MRKIGLFVCLLWASFSEAWAGTAIPFTINMSEAVAVTGTPRVAVDVGGQTRYATYTSGSGTSALTFTLSPQAGDVDLDGVSVSSPIDLNGGTIKDLSGNNLASLIFTPPNTSGIKVNYPSLGMDFVYDADGRYSLNGTVYNDLTSFITAAGATFSRSSTATYYDSAGVLKTAAANTPRFDYDPVTHSSLGLLLEESKINLFLQSQDFSSGSWSKSSAVIVAAATTAPDGALTASKLIVSNGALTTANNSNGGVHQVPTVSASSMWAFSVFAKAAEVNYLRLREGIALGTRVKINLTDGSIVYEQGTSSDMAVTATSVGNGWWRIFATRTTGASETTAGINIKAGIDTGDGVSGIYIWGAQLEQSTFSTSYIPTTTAVTTRSAEVFTIPTTGGWFNGSAGSFMAQLQEASALNTGGSSRVIGSSFSGRFWYRVSGTSSSYIFDGSHSAGVAGTVNSLIRVASSYGDAGLKISQNGGALSSTIFSPPWGNQGYAWVATLFTGHIMKWKYFPAQVASAQLPLLSQ